MKKEALLLIDIQNIYFSPGDMLLHKPLEAAEKATILLKKFRVEEKTSIHIQHNFETGYEILSFCFGQYSGVG